MAIASILSEEDVTKVHRSKSSVDFGRIEFLEIVHVEDPKILYKSAGKHFFFVVGLAVGTSECKDSDFGPGGRCSLGLRSNLKVSSPPNCSALFPRLP